MTDCQCGHNRCRYCDYSWRHTGRLSDQGPLARATEKEMGGMEQRGVEVKIVVTGCEGEECEPEGGVAKGRGVEDEGC